MGTKKKGSELVFNLQWRNKLDNGGDKSNVIGMYDTPATTLNFDTFKSYLLKNSGVVGNDVKVTYLTDDGREWVIHTQEEFANALCAFRLKAKLAEVIFLKLDKRRAMMQQSDESARKNSNDVETQFDNDPNTPPEWFTAYMREFKRDIVKEVTLSVSANLQPRQTKEKEKETAPPTIAAKKIKTEPSKRTRKHIILGETPIDKELLKTLKHDRKLEHKLEKLDAKTKKMKEKKQLLLKTIDLEEIRHKSKQSIATNEVDCSPFMMNASLVSKASGIIHLTGGEEYLHTWKVINSGKLAWDLGTELRLTWGSAEMMPSSRVLRCPPLKPGEKGLISARFHVPEMPGQYESYWNFFHNDVRFGNWLCCAVIVDKPIHYLFSPKKPKIIEESVQYTELNSLVSSFDNDNAVKVDEGNEAAAIVASTNVIDLSRRIEDMKILDCPHCDTDSEWDGFETIKALSEHEVTCPPSNKYGINEKDLIVDLSTNSKEMKNENDISLEGLEEAVKQEENDDDDDNNNNGTPSTNNNSSGDSICEIQSEASDLSSGYDVLIAPECEEREEGSGYVYITIEGNKLPVPKHILRPDFLINAEEAPGPSNLEDDQKTYIPSAPPLAETEPSPAAKLEAEILELEQNIQDTKSFMSHCSTAGSCFSDVNAGMASSTNDNSRLFIFPQRNPGFEVVYPNTGEEAQGATGFCTMMNNPLPTYTWAHSQTQYTLADMQKNGTGSGLKIDPYGPLEQARVSTSEGQSSKFQPIPNFQQSNPKSPHTPPKNDIPASAEQASAPAQSQQEDSVPISPTNNVPQMHILSENLVSGAVNMASSAINTARSVINMIVPPKPEPGKWVNGHWVTENPESLRAKNLRTLVDMGFWNIDLNATLLARYNDDLVRVISDLVQ